MFHFYNFQMEFSIFDQCAQLKHGKHGAGGVAAAESIVFRTYSCIYPLGSRHSSSCIASLTLLGKYALPIPGRKCGLYFYISLAFFFQHSHSTKLQSGNSQFVMTKTQLFRPKYTFFDQNTLFVTKILLL